MLVRKILPFISLYSCLYSLSFFPLFPFVLPFIPPQRNSWGHLQGQEKFLGTFPLSKIRENPGSISSLKDQGRFWGHLKDQGKFLGASSGSEGIPGDISPLQGRSWGHHQKMSHSSSPTEPEPNLGNWEAEASPGRISWLWALGNPKILLKDQPSSGQSDLGGSGRCHRGHPWEFCCSLLLLSFSFSSSSPREITE